MVILIGNKIILLKKNKIYLGFGLYWVLVEFLVYIVLNKRGFWKLNKLKKFFVLLFIRV